MDSAPNPAILNTASNTDKSVGFFNDIFGIGWQNIIDGTSSVGGASQVLFTCFQAMNAVILAAVTVLMFWVTTSGIIGTAHEGESLGKRYSTLWTPIRSAFSISLLVPYPGAGGLCLLQALILKFVFLSIGGANYLAVTTVDFMVKQGGAISTQTAPFPLAEGLAEEMLKNMVIQEYYKSREGEDYGIGIKETSTDGTTGNTATALQIASDLTTIKSLAPTRTGSKGFEFTAPGDRLVYSSFMGEIKTACNGVSDSLCSQENQLGINLANELRPIAQAIVSQYDGGANTPMDQAQINAYNTAILNYVTASQQVAANELASVPPNQALGELTQAVKNNGWSWLGVYYWKIARNNEHAQLKWQTKVTISTAMKEKPMAIMAGNEINASLIRYQNFIRAINKGRIQQMDLATSSSDPAGAWALAGSFFYDAIGSTFPGENTAMKGAANVLARTISSGDPISNLQAVGHQLVSAGSNLLLLPAAFKVTGFLAEAGAKVPKNIPLNSDGEDAIANPAAKIVSAITAFLYPVGLALTGGGVILAYYLPTLPFVLWTSSIVGWIVLTMELMVAAPIWAATHAIPEGEGLAGQHGRQGYMLLFGILVRPSLHVVGFFMSFVIVSVIGHFIGESYLDFTTASNNDNAPIGPISHMIAWVATMLLGVMIVIISTHKTFSLITWLPDNILRWAGGNQPSLGEHGDESRVSSSFNAAIASFRGAATGGVNSAVSAVTAKTPKGNENAAAATNHTQGDKT